MTQGIGSQVHYIPVYRQPYYVKRYGIDPAAFPQAERYYHDCLSLPFYPALTDEDVEQRRSRRLSHAVNTG